MSKRLRRYMTRHQLPEPPAPKDVFFTKADEREIGKLAIEIQKTLAAMTREDLIKELAAVQAHAWGMEQKAGRYFLEISDCIYTTMTMQAATIRELNAIIENRPAVKIDIAPDEVFKEELGKLANRPLVNPIHN
jgi:hypothetical protein